MATASKRIQAIGARHRQGSVEVGAGIDAVGGAVQGGLWAERDGAYEQLKPQVQSQGAHSKPAR